MTKATETYPETFEKSSMGQLQSVVKGQILFGSLLPWQQRNTFIKLSFQDLWNSHLVHSSL